MPRIIRVNLACDTIREEALPQEDFLQGGRFLTSRLVAEEVPPVCEPLGRHNKLVLACGPLAGTLFSSCNRLSIGGKSPLTGGIKESNAGGVTAYMMGRLGIRAIVLEGKPGKDAGWRLLHVSKDGVRLMPADDLAGLGTHAKVTEIRRRFGDKVGITLIGPIGERLQLTAGITNTDPEGEPSRYNGRGGLGAVMGSKRLLAVVYDTAGAGKVVPADPDGFRAVLREAAKRIEATPATAVTYRKLGTSASVNVLQSLGGLPTRNFSTGHFEHAGDICGETVRETILARGGEGRPTHACMPGCLVQCSNIFPDADGKKLCSPLEYENIGLLGSNLDIGSLDVIASLNDRCNDLGCDTIEMGAAMGVAMDAGVCGFGEEGARHLMDEVAKGTPLGRILASGAGIVGKVFGNVRVPAVKNQSMPAYDPRSVKGVGVTFATSPMGADHTAGNTFRAQTHHHLKEGQVALSKGAQRRTACYDDLGMCIMTSGALPLDLLASALSALHGRTVTEDMLLGMGRLTLEREHAFNIAAGLTRQHDRLPEFMEEEANPASGAVFDLGIDEMQDVFEP